MRDIAKRAKVSIGTVSRVLNRHEDVDSELRDRVEGVARKLGYRLSDRTRGVVHAKSKIVGLILVNDFGLNAAQSLLLLGVEEYCSKAGYYLLFARHQYPPGADPAKLEAPAVVQTPGLADCVIIAGSVHSHFLESLQDYGLHYVLLRNHFMDERLSAAPGSVVAYDDEGGSYQATQYLAQLGHQNIWYIGDDSRPWHRNRFRGYSRAMAELNLSTRSHMVSLSDDEFEHGHHAVSYMLEQGRPMTAILAGSDEIAFGAREGLRQHRREVPKDVSLIGFEHEPGRGRSSNLTSVSVDMVEVGRQLAEAAIAEIEGERREAAEIVVPYRAHETKYVSPASSGRPHDFVDGEILLRYLLILAFTLSLPPVSGAAGVTYTGVAGPGLGKHIVLIAGDDAEYHSEEALPELAKILAIRHGFTCTVLFSINPDDGTIDPREKRNIPGLEALQNADLMILFIRWKDLPDEQMKYIVDYVQSGKPIIAIRTGTHPFAFQTSKTYEKWSWNSTIPGWEGGFGRHVLGETWVAHHGKHGEQSTRGLFAPGAEDSPILRGIQSGQIWAGTDTYEVRLPLPETCHTLLLGQVLSWIGSDSDPVKGSVNDPMMPVAWTNAYTAPNGKTARVFTSTMGSADDLENEALRRLLVNATYWAVGLESKIPEKANVALVDVYRPHSFMSEVYTAGLKPSDLALSAKRTR